MIPASGYSKHLLPAGCFLISVFSVAMVYLGFGAHFETNDDPQFVLMFRGLYSANATAELHFFFKFIGYPIRFLYDTIPEFPWYAITLYASMTASLAVVLYLFFSRLEPPHRDFKIALLAVAVVIVFIPHLVLLNFTRVALLVTGTGCAGLLVTEYRKNGWLFAFNFSFIALGWCIRPESAWLAWLGLVPFALALLFLKHVDIRRLNPFAGTAIIFILLSGIDKAMPHGNDPTRDPRALGLTSIYNFGMMSNTEPSPSDQLAQRSVALLLWWDSQPDAGTVDRLSRQDGDGLIRKIVQTAPHALRQTMSVLYRQNFPTAFLILAAMLLIVSTFGFTERQSWTLLAANACFFAGLILVSGFLKFRPRVVNPMIVICALGNGLFLIHALQKQISTPWWGVAIAGVITAFLISPPDRNRLHSRQARHHQYLTALSSSSPVALIGSGMNLLDGLDPWRFPQNLHPLQFLPVSTWTSWYPTQQDGLKHFTGSLEFSSVFSALQKRGTVMVSDSTTMEALSVHGRTFHDTKLTFGVEPTGAGFEELSYGRRLHRWTVSSVTKDTNR
jgi:hypothetical protein